MTVARGAYLGVPPAPLARVWLGAIALILFIEGFGLSLLVGGVPLSITDAHMASMLSEIHEIQRWACRFLIAFLGGVAVLILLARSPIRELEPMPVRESIRVRWLILHLAVLASLLAISALLDASVAGSWLVVESALRPLCAVGALGSLCAAFASAPVWSATLRRNAQLLGCSLLMAAGACLAIIASHSLWTPASRLTLQLARVLLLPFCADLRVDWSARSIATDHFGLIIADDCSGLEGIGLILIFAIAWLCYHRHDYHLPRAAFMIPVAAGIVYVLNAVRIAVLLMIGDAGHPQIAGVGFHSQAGWIGFNLSAIAIAATSRRSRWLNRPATQAGSRIGVENPAVPYLAPLAATLAAGMLSRVVSPGFDFLYPIELLCGLAMLWRYRKFYRRPNWRFDAEAVAVGAGVFVVWLACARLVLAPESKPSALTHLPFVGQCLWVTARSIGAILTVPIIEELAYRGYLMRRLSTADFTTLPYRRANGIGLAISSAAFGVVHGSLWFPGVAAGLIYGVLAKRTDRLGSAIAAHATTNALLAVSVFAFDQWQLW